MKRKKQIKIVMGVAAIFFSACVVVPAFIVLPYQEKYGGSLTESIQPNVAKAVQASPSIVVSVLRSKSKQVEKIPLEEYVKGVVASEMPASFQMEALKAQALSARTFVIKEMLEKKGKVTITDTTKDQVYMSWDELQKAWGKDYKWKRQKIEQAVNGTLGQIILYQGQPIVAAFFSTSNGYTESSKDYWGGDVPYLQAVPSPWDAKSPVFNQQKVFSFSQFQTLLGVQITDDNLGDITQRTQSERIQQLTIGGKTFSGKQVRELLGLNSSDFTWERKGDSIIVSTKGFGHGVGMSQFGANGMAEEGKGYKEIISYYYKGVQVGDIAPYKQVLVAKNE